MSAKPAMTMAEINRALGIPEHPCCDLHGRNCEPPSELCCENCTEADHPGHRQHGPCSNPDLSPNSLAEAAKIDAVVATAVASERERIRQLAEKHQATYDERTPCNCGRTDCAGLVRSRVPFASLLEQP